MFSGGVLVCVEEEDGKGGGVRTSELSELELFVSALRIMRQLQRLLRVLLQETS